MGMPTVDEVLAFLALDWVRWTIVGLLSVLSALFSAMILGFMSNDLLGLEIILENGSETSKKYASRVYPLRQRGTWMLCTLSIGSFAVNVLIALILADLLQIVLGVVVSTFLIVIICELIPQALCHHYALKVAYHTTPVLYFFLVLLSPIAYPVGFILDLIFGKEFFTLYSKEEFKELVDLKLQDATEEEREIMKGALSLATKQAYQVMTGIDYVFMLDVDTELSPGTTKKILKRGFSRIPVFSGNRTNIIGLLFAKDIMLMNSEERIPIRVLLNVFGRNLPSVFFDTTLDSVLKEMKAGQSHIALVRRVVHPENGQGDPYYEYIGMITLEDIIEEILGSEIVDERDVDRERGSYIAEMAHFRYPRQTSSNNLPPSMSETARGEEKEEDGETMLVSFTNQQFSSNMADSYGSRSDDDDAVSSPDIRMASDKSRLLTGPTSPYKTFSPTPAVSNGNGNGTSISPKSTTNGYENID